MGKVKPLQLPASPKPACRPGEFPHSKTANPRNNGPRQRTRSSNQRLKSVVSLGVNEPGNFKPLPKQSPDFCAHDPLLLYGDQVYRKSKNLRFLHVLETDFWRLYQLKSFRGHPRAFLAEECSSKKGVIRGLQPLTVWVFGTVEQASIL